MRWLAYFMSFAAYVAATIAISHAGNFGAELTWAVAAMLMFIVTLIHELGHAVAVSKLGGSLHKIVVFPFQFDVRRRRFGMVTGRHSGDIGGFVAYSLDRIETSKRHIIIAGAGPAANIATAALVMLCWALVTQVPARTVDFTFPPSGSLDGNELSGSSIVPLQPEGHIAESWTTAFVILSISAGLCNLLPFAGSDGSQIARRLRGSNRAAK
ncbi:MAG: hypothetical protein B7Y49_11565 [Sphingomonas sp. 28-62-11]|nr:MAG: hypothetical protein B7Y49_11565 [Sphingomonas sp. 28-62-11]